VTEATKAVSERIPPYFFPNVVKHEDESVFLYPGDSGYEMGDATSTTVLHRARMIEGGIHYRRDFEWPSR